MLAAALATTSAFALHAVIWNRIALPCDPGGAAVHTIYFRRIACMPTCTRSATVCRCMRRSRRGMAFSAAVWAVTALATAAWSPDKMMAFTIPVVHLLPLEARTRRSGFWG